MTYYFNVRLLRTCLFELKAHCQQSRILLRFLYIPVFALVPQIGIMCKVYSARKLSEMFTPRRSQHFVKFRARIRELFNSQIPSHSLI